MGIFNPGGGTGSHPRARAERLELLMGLLGFFTLMAFIQTLVLELRGQNAVGAALLLAGLVAALYLAWRARRKVKL
ncbi:hypothetical protein [Oryzihumus leptocrescens]|uniref:Uncharacterized protein n=1 Tax=Oryzihumus leptocrescens TaxID=297536 RepID=A0A542ZJJ3_9MICO|nr:hypothetical protein [Oryzihumus leptocrescens]TQL60517.1 hypothetical protein FB474_1912 [Oryzihumus leptocrescens]